MEYEIVVTGYIVLIVFLAALVGWEYERSQKRRYSGRYSAFYRDTD